VLEEGVDGRRVEEGDRPVLRGQLGHVRGLADLDQLIRLFRRLEVVEQPQIRVRLPESVQGDVEQLRIGTGDGRVDDDQRPGTDLVPSCDLGGVDDGDSALLEPLSEAIHRLGGVQEQRPARRQPIQRVLPQEAVIQHQEVIREVHLVSVGDRPVADARVRPDRSSGAFSGIVPERLRAHPESSVSGRQDLRAGHPALPSAAVYTYFERGCHTRQVIPKHPPALQLARPQSGRRHPLEKGPKPS